MSPSIGYAIEEIADPKIVVVAKIKKEILKGLKKMSFVATNYWDNTYDLLRIKCCASVFGIYRSGIMVILEFKFESKYCFGFGSGAICTNALSLYVPLGMSHGEQD